MPYFQSFLYSGIHSNVTDGAELYPGKKVPGCQTIEEENRRIGD